MAAENDWPEVVGKLWRARNIWARMARILGQEGAIARVSGMFFKYVVHAVLLLGSNTWVKNPRMGRALGSFQPIFAMHITGRHPRRQVGGIWGRVR